MTDVSILHTPRQLVLFRVGDTHYGFDIAVVGEILPVLTITPTPGAPAGVLGIADVRKQVVPVFDLHWKFGVARPAANPDARLILVETESGPVAMLVDAVEEVVTVGRDDFQSVSTPGRTSILVTLAGCPNEADVGRTTTGLYRTVSDCGRLDLTSAPSISGKRGGSFFSDFGGEAGRAMGTSPALAGVRSSAWRREFQAAHGRR